MTGAPALDRPAFIIAAPRSGSSLLFETLARCGEQWTLGGEAHAVFENVAGWHPRERGFDSNRLTGADATPARRQVLLGAFARRMRDSDGVRWQSLAPPARPAALRFLEKTPKNSLRVPLLGALFPDARFVFLWREPRGNVSSMMEAWRSGRFVTYRALPGWSGLPWSLLLPPGWRELDGASLADVAAFQWRAANETALEDLARLPPAAWCALSYDELTARPGATLHRVCDFLGVNFGVRLQQLARAGLPPSRHTLTAPAPGKWRNDAAAVDSVLAGLEPTWRRLQALPGGSAGGG